MSEEHNESTQGTQIVPITRRSFLKRSSAAAATAGVASIPVLSHHDAAAQNATPVASPVASPSTGGMPGMNMTGPMRADKFLSQQEAQTVDALVSRIFPGTADDPGAHEANVVGYIDNVLGGPYLGYFYKTYTQGPFLVTSETATTVEASAATDIYRSIPIAADQSSRYGFQSALTPQNTYRRGIGFVDAYAQSQFQKNFVDLSTDQQDSIITDMAADKATGFDGPGGKAFFTQLRNDTIEGMFSDPQYGGNQDLAGWKLINFPGAQAFYTPDDLQNPNFHRDPQSLAEMLASQGQ